MLSFQFKVVITSLVKCFSLVPLSLHFFFLAKSQTNCLQSFYDAYKSVFLFSFFCVQTLNLHKKYDNKKGWNESKVENSRENEKFTTANNNDFHVDFIKA